MTRPPIETPWSLHRKAAMAWECLIAANDPTFPEVLVRSSELVRLTEEGRLEPFNVHSLSNRLSEVAEWRRPTRGGGWSEVDPPERIAKLLLARDGGEYEGAPRVDRITDVPVLGPDHSPITKPGHHPDARVLYKPAPDLEGLSAPTSVEHVDDLLAARDLLQDDLLGDFVFADDPSRTHALGVVLYPFVAPAIDRDETAPLHAIAAHDIGEGKGTLVDAMLGPGCGLPVPKMSEVGNQDEWRKRVTSTLLAGHSAVVLDNLTDALDSGPLAAVLTTGVWEDRILGESRNVRLPVNNLFVVTGNNLELSPELTRRTVPMFLDSGEEARPSERDKSSWRHPDIRQWVRRERRCLVEAAMTLVVHYADGLADMLPDGSLHRAESRDGESFDWKVERLRGSFESWSRVVGGALSAAGVEGFLGNLDRLDREANEEAQETTRFLRAWRDHTREPLTAGDLHELCVAGGELRDDLPERLTAVRYDGLRQALGYWLRDHRGQQHGSYRLVREEDARHVRRWYVQERA